MKLLFQTSNGSERVIAEVDSQDDVMAEINKFCNERDFSIPYVRCWGSLDDDGIWYDVSSHTEFFRLIN